MYRRRLTTLFMRHSPASLANVDRVLEQYKGNEEELFRSLERQYGVSGGEQQKKVSSPLTGEDASVGAPWRVSWPDPDPTPSDARNARIRSDDVSGLSGEEVSRILQPRSDEDIAYALQLGRILGLPVCVRGTQHSMGGQCVPSEKGILLDLKRFNRVSFDATTKLVTCDAGATWSDLIVHLNPFGLSPRTMQSYCSFSVGGTVSVNGHGITTDHCLNESIVELRLMLWDGRVVVCGPNAPTEEGKELFGLAVGGYGLFGVILSITMAVAKNVNLEQVSLELPIHSFPEVFESVQNDPDVDIKLSRIDITTFETVTLFIFRKTDDATKGGTTISSLGAEARRMGFLSRLMYKWLAPTMRELRFAIERNTGLALDWEMAKDRNSLMFESAQPLARLVSPFLCVDDTFILQEYFVPKRRYTSWIRAVKPILKELDTATVGITLMNITIRYVQHDRHSVLKYASHEDGMYAFVLYLRIQRTAECDNRLGTFQRRLIDETLQQQGTFYLPYRRQYTHAQLLQSYPSMPGFVALKKQYDPHGLFGNQWFQDYGMPHMPDGQGFLPMPQSPTASSDAPLSLQRLWEMPPPAASAPLRVVPNRFPNAFHALLHCNASRQAFRELFLERVFQVRNSGEVYRAMWLAYYRGTASSSANTANGSVNADAAVYHELYRMFREQQTPLQKGRQAFRSLAQIDEQREELTTETVRLLNRLGKSAQIRSYVSIGDHGRLVMSIPLPRDAPVWIVHDDDGVDSVAAAVERSSADPIGTFVPIDYRGGATFPAVPSNAADLVTMNQGLHHIPQEHLPTFLKEVHRVLRPGGLFIVREHNAEPHLIPMLELAHSVFNALTGVQPLEEQKEIRAFRPIMEWRAVVQSCGLVDTMVYEMQSDDPTVDEMMCFFKPPWTSFSASTTVAATAEPCGATAPPDPEVLPTSRNASNVDDLAAPLITAIAQLPNLLMSVGAKQIDAISDAVQSLEQLLIDISPNAALTKSVLHPTASSVVTMLSRIKPMLAQAQANSASANGSGAFTMHHILPRDLIHAYRAVSRRVAHGAASTEEAFVISIINALQKTMMGGTNSEDPGDAALRATPAPTGSAQDVAATAAAPTKDAVLLLFQRVLKAYPRLLTAEYWREAGISQALQSIALSKELNVERAAGNLAARLDAQSWQDFQSAVDDLCSCRPLIPLHMDLVLNKQPGAGGGRRGTNPWHRAVVAVLGSTSFEVTQAQRWYASVAGYGEMISLIDIAKEVHAAQDEERERLRAEAIGKGNELTPLAKILDDGLRGLTNNVVEVVMTASLHNIGDIERLILVEHRGDDVTASVSHDFFRNGSLLLDGVDLDKHLRYSSLSNTMIGQFFGGPMVVRVQYVSSKPPPQATIAPHIDAIRRNLRIRGLRPTGSAVAPPSWTFFKVCEWMQVEMSQHFSNSMEHTPWYRYPFTDVLGTYFRVLSHQCRAVQKRHGFASTFLSMPFVSSAVPAAVMALLFGQMQLLAAPVKMALGDTYDGKEALVQVVHFVCPEVSSGGGTGVRWSSRLMQLCKGKQPTRLHIVDAERSHNQANDDRRHTHSLALYSIELPAFKPFTDAIRELGRIPGSQIIDIASQEVIVLKIAITAATAADAQRVLQEVLEVPTSAETTRYEYPALVGASEGNKGAAAASTVLVGVSVQIPYLLHLVRLCEGRSSELRLVQVFDFWKG